MRDNNHLPEVPQSLLDYLDVAFPDECPSMALTDREVWFRAGQRDVVNFLIGLREHIKDQQDDPS